MKKLPFIQLKLFDTVFLLKKAIKRKIKEMGKELPKRSFKLIERTWSRDSSILRRMVNRIFAIYNGKRYIALHIRDSMIGHKLGEFAFTRRFIKHKNKDKKLINKI